MFKIPEDLLKMPEKHQCITLEGCTIIESCHHEALVADTLYVNQRVLIAILSGKIEFDFKNEVQSIAAGQVGLLNQSSYAPYRKYGTPGHGYASVLFFLDDSMVLQFCAERKLAKTAALKNEDNALFVSDATLQFVDFVRSVLNLFHNQLKYDHYLLQLKVKELLVYLTSQHPEVVNQLLTPSQPIKKNLVAVMEANFLKYASLEEFAYMSGRSLATFKRDFKTVFKTSPAKWIKDKRLAHAKYLLINTGLNVSDVYGKVGFANYSHFSKAFKDHFGYGPSKVINKNR